MSDLGLALVALAIGIILALAFYGIVHALGVALIVVSVIALLLILAGAWRGRRVRP